MKQLVLTLALAAAFTLPAAAQSMGSVNANAPTVTAAIEFAGGAKLAVTYKALNFGQGSWLERAKSERARNMYNQNAKENPCGSVTLTKDMMIVGAPTLYGDDGVMPATPNMYPDPAWKLCQIDRDPRGRRYYHCGPYSYHPYGTHGYRPLGTYRNYRAVPVRVQVPSARVIAIPEKR